MFDPNLIIDVTPQPMATTLKPIKHTKLIENLLFKIKKVDFVKLVFPEVDDLKREQEELTDQLTNPDGSINKDAPSYYSDRLKEVQQTLSKMSVSKNDCIVLVVKEVIRLAESNNWGLCRYKDFVYLYNSAYWSLFNKDEIASFLSKAAIKMGIEQMDAEFYKYADELFKQFHFAGNLPAPIQPENTTFINLKNGTFEFSGNKRELRDPDRKDFLKYQLPFAYDKDATAPLWKTFLNRVLPDIESQIILAEYIGYLFTHELKFEKALFLYGSGANGKSVVYEVVNALLGRENVSNYSLQSLTDKTGYYRASLQNKLVNYASEINGTLESSFFKQLVSGEPVEARLPYGAPFILENYAKMIFNGNTLPTNVEHTNAYFRRFLILPFEVTIPEHEQDKELPNRIIESELAGIFNWVLEGLERILTNRKFSPCTAAERMLNVYKKQSDTVALFIEDHGYKEDFENYTTLKQLFKEYRDYCLDNGYKPVSNRTLSERLRNLGYTAEKQSIGIVVSIYKY